MAPACHSVFLLLILESLKIDEWIYFRHDLKRKPKVGLHRVHSGLLPTPRVIWISLVLTKLSLPRQVSCEVFY